MNDLASGTSSWSTKLVHGGLRYLEYYEFRLVREALIEREILWQIAPAHHPPPAFRFAAPCRVASGLAAAAGVVSLRPYRRPQPAAADALGRPDPRRGRQAAGAQPLHQGVRIFRLLRRRRAPRGAHRARCGRPRRRDPHPHPRGRDPAGRRHLAGHRRGHHRAARARRSGPARWSMPAAPGSRTCWRSGAGVNAQGQSAAGAGLPHRGAQALRPRPRLHVPEQRRPHRVRHSLSGRFHADRHHRSRLRRRPRQGEGHRPRRSNISATPSANTWPSRSSPEDVVWTYAGVRPLYDDGASEAKAATRDYVFELDTPGGAPLLSIYGGKITTYRRLAEEALERLAPYLRSATPARTSRREAGPANRRCPAATWTSRRSRR